MFESHFGLSGAPFQLNPDPAFYFDSRGHHTALAYLRYGLHEGEGFIVVTGEIGAGKTTLVRTLLNEIDRESIVAASVVSTQLESGDLLRTILTAFGVAPAGDSKAQLIASLEAYLLTVATQGRRALLVVDEAQNLGPQAVEELRMLSNFQLDAHGLLQSFLVGQPELRQLLRSPAMEQLRQRIAASCHLGPMDEAETRAYVEHRLRKVGWTDDPQIEPPAYAGIHRWSRGIPRVINRLCGRVLLAAYLGDRHRIDAAMVEETAEELDLEIGSAQAMPAVERAPAASTIVPAAGAEGDWAADTDRVEAMPAPEGQADPTAVRRPWTVSVPEAPVPDWWPDLAAQIADGVTGRDVLCLVESPADCLVAGALARALREAGLGHPVVAAGLGPCQDELLLRAALQSIPVPAAFWSVGMRADLGRAAARVAELIATLRPAVVLVLGSHDLGVLGMVQARAMGFPVISIERASDPSVEAAGLLPHRPVGAVLAHRTFREVDPAASTAPARRRRAHAARPIASLWTSTLEQALAAARPDPRVQAQAAAFALVACTGWSGRLDPQSIAARLPTLRDLGQRTPVVVWLPDGVARAVADVADVQALRDAGLTAMAFPPYLDALHWLRAADLLVADEPRRFEAETQAFGLPCLASRDLRAALDAPAAGAGSIEALRQRRAPRHPLDVGPDLERVEGARELAQHLKPWLRRRPRRAAGAVR